MVIMTITDPLTTDEYTLKMAQAYWRSGTADEKASFEMFVRKLPEERDFLVVAGLGDALAWLSEFVFYEEDLDVLRDLGHYEEGFLNYLTELNPADLTIRAIPEGTRIGAQTPLLTVTGPRALGTLIEPALLTIIGHQTMVASKAARIVEAAGGRPVWDFSMRRLHGIGAAIPTARAAYIAGCAGTATTAAARLGIPTTGTMAHAYIQSLGRENEQEAFERFLTDYPDQGVLLVDTYDTIEGIEKAIQAARNTGITPKAVRIDSGDLAYLSKLAREWLDREGFPETGIILTDDLNEDKIRDLLAAGTPVDSFGVGTQLGTSADAPNLGIVYKLVEHEVEGNREFVMKTAPGKLTDPGLHQVWRSERDLLAFADEEHDGESLLQEVKLNGAEDLSRIRDRSLSQESPPPLVRSELLAETRDRLSGAVPA